MGGQKETLFTLIGLSLKREEDEKEKIKISHCCTRTRCKEILTFKKIVGGSWGDLGGFGLRYLF